MNPHSSMTIQGVAENLATDLKQYLEAQYHIRDGTILMERQALLDEAGAIAACEAAGVVPFAKADHATLARDIDIFVNRYGRSMEEFRENPPTNIPLEFKKCIYKQVSGRFYSMRFICAGWIWTKDVALREIETALGSKFGTGELAILAAAWIQGLAWKYSIDSMKDFPRSAREQLYGSRAGKNQSWGHSGKFGKYLRPIVESAYPDVADLEKRFGRAFANYDDLAKGWFLNPGEVSLRFDLSAPWYRCSECMLHSAYIFRGHCPGY